MTSKITIALVEPRIPQNTGNIGRLCVCTGADLYLVGSLGFRLGAKHLNRAGMDYLDDLEIQHVAEFQDVLTQKPGWTPYYVSTKAQQYYTDIVYPPKTILVFGSETHGLPATWIESHPAQSIRIPMMPEARSLNLANAVSIVLYEVLRQQHPPGLL